MCVLYQFNAGEGLSSLKFLLLCGDPFGKVIIGLVFKVLVGRDHETECAAGRIAASLPQFRLYELDNCIDKGAGREILAGTGFFFIGVFLKQPFIKVAQAFLLGTVPVQAVNGLDDLFQIFGVVDVGMGIDIDLLDSVFAFSA